jgi:hypothetical protein
LSEQRSVYGPKLNQGKSKINTTSTLACYKLENTEKQGPEKLTINFNNFPYRDERTTNARY